MERFMEYSLKGYCCSQILLQLGLDEIGEENETLIKAMFGLCGGLQSGLVCGALSGGVCLISLLCEKGPTVEIIPELVQWFEDEFENVNCEEILNGDAAAKAEKCPHIVMNTYEKIMELLVENQ